MRQYKITAYVGLETHTKVVEAKSSKEATEKALAYGHKMSNFGNGSFLRGVFVKPVKNKPTPRRFSCGA